MTPRLYVINHKKRASFSPGAGQVLRPSAADIAPITPPPFEDFWMNFLRDRVKGIARTVPQGPRRNPQTMSDKVISLGRRPAIPSS